MPGPLFYIWEQPYSVRMRGRGNPLRRARGYSLVVSPWSCNLRPMWWQDAFNVSGAPSPCVTAQWVTGATRVLANGMPVLLMDSQAICAPNGTPLMIVATQTRVIGT